MITEKDLHEAIAECQGERNPNANTCVKLAAFYTILDHIKEQQTEDPGHSYQAEQPAIREVLVKTIDYDGTSEFAQAVYGRDTQEVMALMDELMDAVMVTNPPLYKSVMRRLL